MPFEKYSAFTPVELPDRSWPSKRLTHAPRWCSVDLRDGNQALIEPMTVDEKLRMYELLLEVGFLEIEVGFPAASQPDFDFIRKIIDDGLVPDNITIQVLCQARKELIERTVEALDGTRKAIFHLYNSTSALQRKVVFNMDRQQIIDLAVSGTELVRDTTRHLTHTEVEFEYSPESFTGTELDFALEISSAVCKTWGASPSRRVIINLPSTVELATPNIYADQIEYFCRNFDLRDSSIVSLHTHNDRGTGIAATELALMAGAERVEGTLFGNGERTGNCDLVTVAMNLFSQGIDPQLDLRDMPGIRETVGSINKLPVHPRHPYAGDLVFTAFSGSHQDAIRKGMSQVDRSRWEVPYLPIDPEDVGASYKESVRINSQSGKGGVGFVLEEHFGIYLPREMLIEFSQHVQSITEDTQTELSPTEMLEALVVHYQVADGPYKLEHYSLSHNERSHQTLIEAKIKVAESKIGVDGEGPGPTDALVNGLAETLNEPLRVRDCIHQTIQREGIDENQSSSMDIISMQFAESIVYGIGVDNDPVSASLIAVMAAMNRRWKLSERRTSPSSS
ncbi:MAG: 2-isopropylmalate synthase [Gammaproteobacteria bacterium]|nr:2-isopropylmalate synthase [Gammaproteobacteria bacterium]